MTTLDPVSDRTGPHRVRLYEPGDRRAVLHLFREVWDSTRTADWIEHRFERTPYVDGPAMVVAEADGRVVGARPFVPVPLAGPGVDCTGVYFCNDMVHPDVRGQGLFTRLVEQSLDVCASAGADVAFFCANDAAASVHRRLGLDEIGVGPVTYYRVQRPGAYLPDTVPKPVATLAEGVVDAAAEAYHVLRRRRRDLDGRWAVRTVPGIPARTLSELYEGAPPSRIHTRREPELYRWLAGDPFWHYQTYVAECAGEPTAGLLVRSRGDAAEIVDVVPPTPTSRRAPTEVLLEAALTDHRDAAIVTIVGPVAHEQLAAPGLWRSVAALPSTHPLLCRFLGGLNAAFVGVLDEGSVDTATAALDVWSPEDWAWRVRPAPG